MREDGCRRSGFSPTSDCDCLQSRREAQHAPYGVGWAEKENAPVPIQGQMRENTSAVPPCLTEKSAHLIQAPTRPKPANAGSASRNTCGLVPPRSARPRRSICRFAATGLSALSPALCACAAGLISASTVYHSVARRGGVVNTGHVFPVYFYVGTSSCHEKAGIPCGTPADIFTYSAGTSSAAASSAAGAIRASSAVR